MEPRYTGQASSPKRRMSTSELEFLKLSRFPITRRQVHRTFKSLDDCQPGLILWDGSFASTGSTAKMSRTHNSYQNSSVHMRLSRVSYDAEQKEVVRRVWDADRINPDFLVDQRCFHSHWHSIPQPLTTGQHHQPLLYRRYTRSLLDKEPQREEKTDVILPTSTRFFPFCIVRDSR